MQPTGNIGSSDIAIVKERHEPLRLKKTTNTLIAIIHQIYFTIVVKALFIAHLKKDQNEGIKDRVEWFVVDIPLRAAIKMIPPNVFA